MKNPCPRVALFAPLLTLLVCASVLAQTLTFQGRVVNVSDGETVTVLTRSNTEFQVRCRGIDAPKGQEDFARDAKQRLFDVLLDEPVTVRYAQRTPDGSLVGTIEWNGRDVCIDQIRAGMAWFDDQTEQRRSTQQQYARAEAGARNNRVGLWSGAPLQSASGETAIASDARTDSTATNATVDVRGYFRKDGTYVAGHKRTAPDGNFDNNWSTQGNVNPYTGEVGTKKRSRWMTALKWVGIGATIGALMYLDAKYPTATARCNDGTYSYSLNRRGTCAYHGGVAYWLR